MFFVDEKNENHSQVFIFIMTLPLQHRPRRLVKKKLSYLEPTINNLPRKPRKCTKDIILQQPHHSIFKMYQSQGLRLEFEDENQFFPLTINKFQVENGEKYIFGDIITAKGIGTNTDYLKANVPFEYWISAVIGYEDELVQIGWLTRSELNHYKIKDGDKYCIVPWNKRKEIWYQNPVIFCNHKGQCGCDKYKVCIRGEIEDIDEHIYYGQLTPEFKFKQTEKICGINGNGWVYGSQLNSENHYKNLSIIDHIYYNIRKSIANEENKYLDYLVNKSKFR